MSFIKWMGRGLVAFSVQLAAVILIVWAWSKAFALPGLEGFLWFAGLMMFVPHIARCIVWSEDFIGSRKLHVHDSGNRKRQEVASCP